MDEFFNDLKDAVEGAGFSIMPDDEFKKWLEDQDAYRNSAEGRAEEMLEEALLDYYLDNIAKYKFTDEMDEISGFGGGYEKCCRAMLDAGLQWLDANPDAEPKFKGNSNVYGVIIEDNDDAKALSDAVVSVTDEATGAMHQATVGHCLWIRANGWDAYVEAKMINPD